MNARKYLQVVDKIASVIPQDGPDNVQQQHTWLVKMREALVSLPFPFIHFFPGLSCLSGQSGPTPNIVLAPDADHRTHAGCSEEGDRPRRPRRR